MPLLFYLSMSRARLSGLLENGLADVVIAAACTSAMTLIVSAMRLEWLAYRVLLAEVVWFFWTGPIVNLEAGHRP